jgi:hypothetical protein
LKELFGVLDMFANYECDCEAVADALQKTLEIDNWSSFLELENDDLLEIKELNEDMRKELLELISFAKGMVPDLTSFNLKNSINNGSRAKWRIYEIVELTLQKI